MSQNIPTNHDEQNIVPIVFRRVHLRKHFDLLQTTVSQSCTLTHLLYCKINEGHKDGIGNHHGKRILMCKRVHKQITYINYQAERRSDDIPAVKPQVPAYVYA